MFINDKYKLKFRLKKNKTKKFSVKNTLRMLEIFKIYFIFVESKNFYKGIRLN